MNTSESVTFPSGATKSTSITWGGTCSAPTPRACSNLSTLRIMFRIAPQDLEAVSSSSPVILLLGRFERPETRVDVLDFDPF